MRWSRVVSLALMACGSMQFGCSALIDVHDWQCDTAAQCVHAKLGSLEAPDREDNSRCTRDDECSKNTPRCMRGTCVAQDIADKFLCMPSEDDEPSSDTVKYSFNVMEYVSRMPPKNLTVKACQTADVTCRMPVAMFTDSEHTGLVQLELPKNFLGFFEVKSDDALPALSYLTKPVRHDWMDRDLQVSAPSTVMLLSNADMTDFDPSRGLALVEAFDCDGTPSGGVHFSESKNDSKPFYIVNRAPNSDVQVSSYDPDSNVADGGFINLQPGYITFTARYGVDGPVLGEFNAQVRANTITFIDMYF
jgi:hypothetical protein